MAGAHVLPLGVGVEATPNADYGGGFIWARSV
jgi:hypothetical protein